jgi:hypothetical protein
MGSEAAARFPSGPILCFYSLASGLALGNAKPLAQWIMDALPSINPPGREADQSTTSNAEFKNSWAIYTFLLASSNAEQTGPGPSQQDHSWFPVPRPIWPSFSSILRLWESDSSQTTRLVGLLNCCWPSAAVLLGFEFSGIRGHILQSDSVHRSWVRQQNTVPSGSYITNASSQNDHKTKSLMHF